METRLFSDDPITGVRRLWHYDHSNGQATIETQADVTAIIEANKYLANTERQGFKGFWHRVASIPLSIYFDLKKKGIVADQKELYKWLNDKDNDAFRIKKGRL